jgi:hypothetical protein
MKSKLELLLIFLLMLNIRLYGQSSFEVSKFYSYNIIKSNDNALRSITLTNISNQVLDFKVSTVCCFKTLNISPSTINPNETATIKFEYDLNRLGPFSKSINIKCSNGESFYLNISGEVVLATEIYANSRLDSVVDQKCNYKNGFLWGNYEQCDLIFADGTKSIGNLIFVDNHYGFEGRTTLAGDEKILYESYDAAVKDAYRLAKGLTRSDEGRYYPPQTSSSSYSNSSSSPSNVSNSNNSKPESSNSTTIEFREIKTNNENCGGFSYRLFDVYKNGSSYKTLMVVSHNDEWWSSCPFDCTFCTKRKKSDYTLKEFLISMHEADAGKTDNYILTER